MAQSLRLDGDWYGLTRAMYAERADWPSWGEEFIDRCQALVPHPVVGLQTLELNPDGTVRGVDLISLSESAKRECEAMLPLILHMGRPSVRAIFFPARSVLQLSRVTAALPFALRGQFRRWLSGLGVSDGFAVTIHPAPGVVVTLFVLTRDAVHLSQAERTLLTRLGLHLESSTRLRRRPETVVAVLGHGGALEFMRNPSASPEAYRALTATLREARGRGADGLALWRGLIGGELSVVERGEGSRSRTYFFENPPHRQPMRSLTPGEQDVVSMVCQGHSAKAVAYGLGISEGAVSMRLESAAGKVGLASRLELVRLAAMLTRDPRSRFTETALTTAERDVLGLLAQGLSNGEIARARGRSVRTIANQVSALLSKTRAANRKVLASMGDRPVGPDTE